MATQTFHFSNAGISSGQRFYLKDEVSGIFLKNLNINSNFPIVASNLLYNTGNQSIDGTKTFNAGVVLAFAQGNTPTTLAAARGIQWTALGGNNYDQTIYAAYDGFQKIGINFNREGLTDLQDTIIFRPLKIEAFRPIEVSGTVVANNLVYNTGNQTISGVKTFANNISVAGTGTFNALDLNNIDDFSLSGVDITITNGNVVLTNPVSAPNLVYNTGNQTISGVKTFVTGIDIANSLNPQSLRVFNATGTNSGEFGLFSWVNNELRIGATQTQSGLLRDVILTGRNVNINASGVLNIFDNTNIVGNLSVSGTEITLNGSGIVHSGQYNYGIITFSQGGSFTPANASPQTYFFSQIPDLGMTTSAADRTIRFPAAVRVKRYSVTFNVGGTLALGTTSTTIRLNNITDNNTQTIYTCNPCNNYFTSSSSLAGTFASPLVILPGKDYNIRLDHGGGFSTAPTAVRHQVNLYVE